MTNEDALGHLGLSKQAAMRLPSSSFAPASDRQTGGASAAAPNKFKPLPAATRPMPVERYPQKAPDPVPGATPKVNVAAQDPRYTQQASTTPLKITAETEAQDKQAAVQRKQIGPDETIDQTGAIRGAGGRQRVVGGVDYDAHHTRLNEEMEALVRQGALSGGQANAQLRAAYMAKRQEQANARTAQAREANYDWRNDNTVAPTQQAFDARRGQQLAASRNAAADAAFNQAVAQSNSSPYKGQASNTLARNSPYAGRYGGQDYVRNSQRTRG